VFYQAPLYPYVLGVLYALLGHNLTFVRLAQALMGSAACGVLCIAVARWFGGRAGIAAGAILALYGPALFFDSLLQKSVLDVFVLSVMLLLTSVLKDRPSTILAAALGMAAGCFALTRENGVILIPVLLGWLLWLPEQRAARASALLVGALVVLAPVAIHNRLAGGVWLLTTSQLGPNLYIGNSDTATGTYVPLRPGRGNVAFEQKDAAELAAESLGRPAGPAEVSVFWRNRAFDWIRGHPRRWLRLTAFKLVLLANRREAPDTEDPSTYAEWSAPLRLTDAVFNFGLLAPLALFGVWITRHRWRQLCVLYALGVSYSLTVVLFYVLDRYRYPLVPLLAVFGGAAIAEAATWWRGSRAVERTRTLLAVCTFAVLCNWPISVLAADTTRALTHFNIGNALQEAGRLDEAIVEYRMAERLLPSNAATHSNLGAALDAKGEHEAAIVHYRQAIQLDPNLVKAHNNLGMALASAGQYDEALAEFAKALVLDPHSAETRYDRGTALAAQGRVDEAIVEFAEALRIDPARADAHINMGVLLAQTGRLADAIEHFRLALQLQPDSPVAKANLERAETLAHRRR
jgi:tetratricopeptide (TPR) repeat protein